MWLCDLKCVARATFSANISNCCSLTYVFLPFLMTTLLGLIVPVLCDWPADAVEWTIMISWKSLICNIPQNKENYNPILQEILKTLSYLRTFFSFPNCQLIYLQVLLIHSVNQEILFQMSKMTKKIELWALIVERLNNSQVIGFYWK